MRRIIIFLTFILVACLTQISEARKLALLVGVDDYESIQPLRCCVNDMNTLKEALMKIGFKENNIQILVTGGAFRNYPLKKNIEKKLSEILSAVQPGDMVLIAFAGHGAQIGKKIYFCPTDTDMDDLDGTSISITKVMDDLAQSKARFKWVIIDACRNDPVSSRDARGLQAVPAPPASTGIALFQSCAEGEKSYEERDGGNGYFTKNFAAALSGNADSDHNGKLTLMEICNWTIDHTKADVMKAEKKIQRPYLSGSVTNFIINKNIYIEEATALVEEARKAVEKKDYKQAIEKYKKAIALYPNNEFWNDELKSVQHIINQSNINVPQDYATIAEAYNHVTDNGVITIQPGNYELPQTLVVNRPVTFKGNAKNAEDVVIDCPGSHAFQITGGSPSFQNLTVSNGANRCYSFYITSGSPKLFNCVITSRKWAGICVRGKKSNPLFESCIIKNCETIGAEVAENALVSFKDCEFYGNEVTGISVITSGNPTLTGCKIHDGKLGGIYIGENALGSFKDCDIFGNKNSGILVCDSGNPTVTGCKFHENGCGMVVEDSGCGTYKDCEFYNNEYLGIQVHRSGNPTVIECKIHDNKQCGICINSNALGKIRNCEIYGNECPGVHVYTSGNPTVSGCKIHDNKESGVLIEKEGLGMFNNNTLKDNYMNGSLKNWNISPDAGRVLGSGNAPPLHVR